MKYLLATSLVVGSLATLAPAAQARDGIGAGGALLAYLAFPHVASRIDRFLGHVVGHG